MQVGIGCSAGFLVCSLFFNYSTHLYMCQVTTEVSYWPLHLGTARYFEEPFTIVFSKQWKGKVDYECSFFLNKNKLNTWWSCLICFILFSIIDHHVARNWGFVFKWGAWPKYCRISANHGKILILMQKIKNDQNRNNIINWC